MGNYYSDHFSQKYVDEREGFKIELLTNPNHYTKSFIIRGYFDTIEHFRRFAYIKFKNGNVICYENGVYKYDEPVNLIGIDKKPVVIILYISMVIMYFHSVLTIQFTHQNKR